VSNLSISGLPDASFGAWPYATAKAVPFQNSGWFEFFRSL